jgi:hypothetical protein
MLTRLIIESMHEISRKKYKKMTNQSYSYAVLQYYT